MRGVGGHPARDFDGRVVPIIKERAIGMERLIVELEKDKLIWLRRIITDEDRDEALAFMHAVLEPKLREAERPGGMKRAFDVDGADGQVGGRW